MSYCRFGSDDSDVYMFPHVEGYILCAGCDIGESQVFDTPKQALLHLVKHLERGDKVPTRALKRLLEEIKEE